MTKITYLGHAALLLENNDLKLLQDPWLEGPSHFNSWYHFPRSIPVKSIPTPSHIYISHSHQDHLSKETLSKIDKKTKIIIADVDEEFKGQPPIRTQVESLGFRNITELGNFEQIKIGNTKITMFISQYDSGICIQDKNSTVLNTNDCPIESLMGRIKAKFSPIDIAFMLPIAAAHFPQCYKLEDLDETRYHGQLMTIARFIQRAIYLQPKVVVPYACMYAHFVTESKYLKYGFSPKYALEQMKSFVYPHNKRGPKIKPVLMAPGDYWTNTKGYHKVSKFNWNNIEDEYQSAKKFYNEFIKLRIKNGNELTYTSTYSKPIEIKKITGIQKEEFQKDFSNFMKRLFKITKKTDDFKIQFDFGWFRPVIDFRNKKVFEKKSSWDVRYTMPPELFDFFIKNPPEWGNVVNSYRIKIYVKKGQRQSEYTFQKYMLNAGSLHK